MDKGTVQLDKAKVCGPRATTGSTQSLGEEPGETRVQAPRPRQAPAGGSREAGGCWRLGPPDWPCSALGGLGGAVLSPS